MSQLDAIEAYVELVQETLASSISSPRIRGSIFTSSNDSSRPLDLSRPLQPTLDRSRSSTSLDRRSVPSFSSSSPLMSSKSLHMSPSAPSLIHPQTSASPRHRSLNHQNLHQRHHSTPMLQYSSASTPKTKASHSAPPDQLSSPQKKSQWLRSLATDVKALQEKAERQKRAIDQVEGISW